MAKVLVSLDDRLLARMDRAAREHGLNRSAFLARILERELKVEPPRRRADVEQAVGELRSLFASFGGDEDSTEVIRGMRDER